MRSIISFFFIFLFSVDIAALTLNDTEKTFDVVEQPLFYKEPIGVALKDIVKLIESKKIDQLETVNSVSYESGAFWLIREVTNNSDISEWTLHFGDAVVEKIDLFVIGKSQQHLRSHYDSMDAFNRLLPTGVALNFKLPTGDKSILALRMEADLYDQTAVINLKKTSEFQIWSITQIILYLVILGGVAGLSLYSILLFILSRDSSYAWYAMLSSVMFFIILGFYGYLYPLFNFEHINRYFDYLLFSAGAFLLLIFVYKLLELRSLSVVLSKIYWVYAVMIFIAMLVSALISITLYAQVVGFLISIEMLLIIFTAVLAIKKGTIEGWFLLFAWLPITLVWIASFILSSFSHVGAIGFNIELASYVAMFAQLLLFLLAIVNKINVLQKQKILAENMNHEKSRFIAAASHDLRQPLHSIGLFVSLLDKHVQAEGRQFFAHIKTSLSAANRMFSDVLDLSRFEAGVIKPEIIEVELNTIFQQLINEFSSQAQSKDIQLRYRHSSLWVLTDRALLERILRNLLNNAIRHTQNGGILLAARLRNGRVWVECWDTGVGIPENSVGEIFSEYHQLNSNIDVVDNKNIGLGLSIVQRLCALLEINVWVESKVDKGSVFRLSLPHLIQPSKPEKIIKYKSRDVFSPSYNYRIWVLDNDESILEAMSETLSEWGCDVIAANSLDKLIEQTQHKNEPDLLMVDLDLGTHINGFDVINEFRQKFPGISVVMITGNTDSEVIERAKQYSITLLYKPLSTLKLRQLLQHI